MEVTSNVHREWVAQVSLAALDHQDIHKVDTLLTITKDTHLQVQAVHQDTLVDIEVLTADPG